MLTRADIRRYLDELCRDDDSLDALCVDYFPDIFRNFASGMTRTKKVTTLFLNVDEGAIVAALRALYGAQFERLLQAVSTAPSPAAARTPPPMASPKEIHRALRAVVIDELSDGLTLPPPEATAMAVRSVSVVQGLGAKPRLNLDELIRSYPTKGERSPSGRSRTPEPPQTKELESLRLQLEALEVENEHLRALVVELSIENKITRNELRKNGTPQSLIEELSKLRNENSKLLQEKQDLMAASIPADVRATEASAVRIRLKQRAQDGEVDSTTIADVLGMSKNWVSSRAGLKSSKGRPTLESKCNHAGEQLRGRDGRFRYGLDQVLGFVEALERWVSRCEGTPFIIPLLSTEDERIVTKQYIHLTAVISMQGMPASSTTAKKWLSPPVAFCLSSAGQGYSLLYPRERLERLKENTASL